MTHCSWGTARLAAQFEDPASWQQWQILLGHENAGAFQVCRELVSKINLSKEPQGSQGELFQNAEAVTCYRKPSLVRNMWHGAGSSCKNWPGSCKVKSTTFNCCASRTLD